MLKEFPKSQGSSVKDLAQPILLPNSYFCVFIFYFLPPHLAAQTLRELWLHFYCHLEFD